MFGLLSLHTFSTPLELTAHSLFYKIFISFNKNKDLGIGNNSQQWSKPQLVFQKPGYILWYPSLQPLDTEEDIKERRTSLKLGKRARFFVKRIKPGDDEYASEHIIEFEK